MLGPDVAQAHGNPTQVFEMAWQTQMECYHGSDITQSKWVISAQIILTAFTPDLSKHQFQIYGLLG